MYGPGDWFGGIDGRRQGALVNIRFDGRRRSTVTLQILVELKLVATGLVDSLSSRALHREPSWLE